MSRRTRTGARFARSRYSAIGISLSAGCSERWMRKASSDSDLAPQYPSKHRGIDIPARQHDTDSLASPSIPLLSCPCKRRRSGTFGDVVSGRVHEAHRARDLFVTDGDNVVHLPSNDFERFGYG